jgi:endonuclease/exonuclease/phosphatase family metal-dependent hydrolase
VLNVLLIKGELSKVKRGPLKVFYSYAHQDEKARDTLDQHMELLSRRNLILRWHDRHIVPGSEWDSAIQEALDSADIILLLVSRAFMASRYVKEEEIPAAMREHEAGRARVVPVLLENVPGWRQASFARLELLPTKGRAVSQWRDPVAAFADVARGVGRVAKDIIVAGGGPFEFGAHEFTEAELSGLRIRERKHCTEGLGRLRSALNDQVSPRRYERNLLVANWALRKFGALAGDRRLPEALYYMAQVISAFDLVALQEVDRKLDQLEALLDILGPDWSFLVTDVAPGAWGNNERFAILYYQPRVEFRHFSSNLVMPPERSKDGESQPAEQLARPPLLAAFRSGDWEFQVCTTHIVWAGSARGSNALSRRLREVRDLGKYLRVRTRYDQTDLLLLGDFQIEYPGSLIHQTLLKSGVQLPDSVLLPAHVVPGRYYSLIGFVSSERKMPLADGDPPGGVVQVYDHVLRDKDFTRISRSAAYRVSRSAAKSKAGLHKSADRLKDYQRWRTYQISDHLPLWVELALPV